VTFDLKTEWARRPWWLNGILLFCIFMTLGYGPFDVVLKPLERDEDVWLGFIFTGWAAKVGGTLHWIVYAALAWGIWKMAPWAWWLGSLYATQVALAMFLWPVVNGAGGWTYSLIAGGLFSIPAIAFWRARSLFGSTPGVTA